MNEPKSVSDFYSGFLEAGDLDGKEITLEIESISSPTAKDKFPDGHQAKTPIVKFKGAKKLWGMNKTCAKTIRLLYGNSFEPWIGKKITIYPTTCNAFGDPKTPCIRVKNINPETGKPAEIF
jgi:hypothetical protein